MPEPVTCMFCPDRCNLKCSQDYIDLELASSAHNYHPLPVVSLVIVLVASLYGCGCFRRFFVVAKVFTYGM